MTWILIEPDFLDLQPARITTDQWDYRRHRLTFDGTTARVVDGSGTVWEQATPDSIEQDTRAWSWRLHFGPVVWEVTKARQCACGPVAPLPLGT